MLGGIPTYSSESIIKSGLHLPKLSWKQKWHLFWPTVFIFWFFKHETSLRIQFNFCRKLWGEGGKGREREGREEGTRRGPQFKKNDPPSSDGWLRACKLASFLSKHSVDYKIANCWTHVNWRSRYLPTKCTAVQLEMGLKSNTKLNCLSFFFCRASLLKAAKVRPMYCISARFDP